MLKSSARLAGTTQGRNTIEESQYVSSLGHKNMKNNLEFLIVPQASPPSLAHYRSYYLYLNYFLLLDYFIQGLLNSR
jgi:hypothetical protein